MWHIILVVLHFTHGPQQATLEIWVLEVSLNITSVWLCKTTEIGNYSLFYTVIQCRSPQGAVIETLTKIDPKGSFNSATSVRPVIFLTGLAYSFAWRFLYSQWKHIASLEETGQWTAVSTVRLECSKQIRQRWTFSFFLKPKVLVDVTEVKMVRGWEVKRTYQTFFPDPVSLFPTSRSLNHS